MSDVNDLELVRQAQGGDRQAFEQLVGRYEKTVYNVALRMTRNSVDAEDISQSTFLKAYESLASFNPRFKFFSWLYRIVVNESLNHLRDRRPQETLDEDLPSEHDRPDTRVERNETTEQVLSALMKLNVDYRAVIVLKHLQGLSYEEISQVLDISEKKVKSRLFSARMILKDVLMKGGVGGHA